MGEFWKGIISTVIAAAVIGIVGWAWQRHHAHLEALESENESLKTQIQERTDYALKTHLERLEQAIRDVIQKLDLTILSVTKLEVKIEGQEKVLPLVDKLSKDIHAFHIWRRENFPERPKEDLS